MAVENNKESDLHCGDGWRWDRCGRVRRPMCFRAYRCGDEGRHDGDGESKLPSDETDSGTWWADAEKKESSVKYVFYGEFLEQNPVGESWPIHEEGYESQKTLIR